MDNSTDKCCRCACYGNGAIGIVVAQMLLLFGALLSSAAMGDCQLVSGTPSYWLPDNLRDYPEPYNPIDSNIDPEPNFQEQTVGFFFWELENGECSWHLFDDNMPNWWYEEIWELYFDLILDSQWRVAMVFAALATWLAWMLFFASCSFACLTQVRPARYLWGMVIMVVVVCCQCMAFVVFRSNFCEDNYDCEIGRTAWFVFAASICYFLAALSFCLLMKDFPGKARDADAEEKKEEDEENKDEPVPPPPPPARENEPEDDEEKGIDEKQEEPEKPEEPQEEPQQEEPQEEPKQQEEPHDDPQEEEPEEEPKEEATKETPGEEPQEEVVEKEEDAPVDEKQAEDEPATEPEDKEEPTASTKSGVEAHVEDGIEVDQSGSLTGSQRKSTSIEAGN